MDVEDWTTAPFRSPGFGFGIEPFVSRSPGQEIKSETVVQRTVPTAANAHHLSPSAPSDDAENQVNGRARKETGETPSSGLGAAFKTPAPHSTSSELRNKSNGSALKEHNYNNSVVAPQSSDKDEAHLESEKPRPSLPMQSRETRSPLKEAKLAAPAPATAAATTSAANDENQATRVLPLHTEAQAEPKPTAATASSKAEYKAALKAKRASEKAVASFAAAVAAAPPAKTKNPTKGKKGTAISNANAAINSSTLTEARQANELGSTEISSSSSGGASSSGDAGTKSRDNIGARPALTTVPMTPGMLAAKHATPSLMAAAKARVDGADKTAVATTATSMAAVPKLKTTTTAKSTSVDDVSIKTQLTTSDVIKHNKRVFRSRSSSLTRDRKSSTDSGSSGSATMPSAFAMGQRRPTMPAAAIVRDPQVDLSSGTTSVSNAAANERSQELKHCNEKASIGVHAPLKPIVQSPTGLWHESEPEDSSSKAAAPAPAPPQAASAATPAVTAAQPSLNWRPLADTEVRRPRPRVRGASVAAASAPATSVAAVPVEASAVGEVKGTGVDSKKAATAKAAPAAPPISRRGFGGSGLSFQPLHQQHGASASSSSGAVAAAARLSAGSPGLQAAAGRVAWSKSLFEAHNNKKRIEAAAEATPAAAAAAATKSWMPMPSQTSKEIADPRNSGVGSGSAPVVKATAKQNEIVATATAVPLPPSTSKHSPIAVPNVLAAAAAELSASLSALGGSFVGNEDEDNSAYNKSASGEDLGALLTPWAVGSFATDDTSSSNLSDLSALDIEAILAGAGENSAIFNRAHDGESNDNEEFIPGGKLNVSAVSAKLLRSPLSSCSSSSSSVTGVAAEVAAEVAATAAAAAAGATVVVEGAKKLAAQTKNDIATDERKGEECGEHGAASTAIAASIEKEVVINAHGSTPTKESSSPNEKALLGFVSPVSGRASIASPALESPAPTFGVGTMNDYRALTLLYTHAGKANHKSNRASPANSATKTGVISTEKSMLDTPRAVLAEIAFSSSNEVNTAATPPSSSTIVGDAATIVAVAEPAMASEAPLHDCSTPVPTAGAAAEPRLTVSSSPDNMMDAETSQQQGTRVVATAAPAAATAAAVALESNAEEPVASLKTVDQATSPAPPPAANGLPPSLPISPGLVQRTALELRELFAECAAQRAALATAAGDAQTAQDAFSTLARSIAQTNAMSMKASMLRNRSSKGSFKLQMTSTDINTASSTPNVESTEQPSEENNGIGVESYPPRWWKASGMLALTLLVASAGVMSGAPKHTMPLHTSKGILEVPLTPVRDLPHAPSDASATQSLSSQSLPRTSESSRLPRTQLEPPQSNDAAAIVSSSVALLSVSQLPTSPLRHHPQESVQISPTLAQLVAAPAPAIATADTSTELVPANAVAADGEVAESWSATLIALNQYALRDMATVLPATQKMVTLLTSVAPTSTPISSLALASGSTAITSSMTTIDTMQTSSKSLVSTQEVAKPNHPQWTPRLLLAARFAWRSATDILRKLDGVASLPMAPIICLVVLFGLL